MDDNAQRIDKNFIHWVRQQNFPQARSHTSVQQAGLDQQTFINLFDSQLKSRHIDLQARILKRKNLAFYDIGSSGHEGNAVIGFVFPYTDLAFLHYRSGALFIQRTKQLAHLDPVKDILLSLVASSKDPIAAGRHKVFGSVELNVPPQTSTIASQAPKAIGAALSLPRAHELNVKHNLAADGVVLCSIGDASLNHASMQAALNAAQWIARDRYPLPLIFICEDNGFGISVPTPPDWVEASVRNRPGIKYIQADGLNLADIYQAAKQAETVARGQKKPVFLHSRCVRLLGHASSDLENQYLSTESIAAHELDDPLLHSARILIENKWMSSEDIINYYEKIRNEISELAQQVINQPKLANTKEVMRALIPKIKSAQDIALPDEAQRQKIFAEQYEQFDVKRDLRQQINFALTDLMLQYDNIVLFGEDVSKKGGVYRVTSGLQQKFGHRRVFDTLLDETMILGTAIGLAHNGFLPIPEIQFLAYLHNAEDQLRGEAATLPFFSNGQYRNPMIIRIPSFAYQKGFGGHFHNDNSIAVIRDIPGLIIACPSNGDDAAKMLRTCVVLAHAQGRVIIFLEPIALYRCKDLHESGDQAWLSTYSDPSETIELGELGLYGNGQDIAIISYGNGYYLSRQAVEILRQRKINVRVIDLRWLAPLNEVEIIKAVSPCKNILVVDECRRTGSLSEALMTLLLEKLHPLPPIKRITAEDSFIPLGDAAQWVLPSRDDIVKVASQMIADE
ncbi:MAG: thiamine pyrophosphate-dependent enzyme [Gammaproteobacteria bacterium]